MTFQTRSLSRVPVNISLNPEVDAQMLSHPFKKKNGAILEKSIEENSEFGAARP